MALPFSRRGLARNAALAAFKTVYVFISDDDIIFTALTDVAVLTNYLDHDPRWISWAILVDLGLRKLVDRAASPRFPGSAQPRIPLGRSSTGKWWSGGGSSIPREN